ncbi:MAG: hypothetical protein HOY71_04655 [Nonomuraea sp.]|nr:hypothetical protein [Nonomuraea sp.]
MASWEQAHRRYRLAHEVAGDFAGRGTLEPWLPEIEAEYGELDAFLRDVQVRYFRAIEARLDDYAGAELTGVHEDFRRLLGEYAGHPALAEGLIRFRSSVLAATGVDPGVPYEKGRHDVRPVRARFHRRSLCPVRGFA